MTGSHNDPESEPSRESRRRRRGDLPFNADEPATRPARFVVLSSAPVRTADVGGWSDTWFAEFGLVCNIALEHRVPVRLEVDASRDCGLTLELEATNQRIEWSGAEGPMLHPMLEAALIASGLGHGTTASIGATVESGSGLGTSAAVLVALVAALNAATGKSLEAGSIAAEAHRIETESGRQAGVQDHVAAAFGGISLISVDYPRARRRAVFPSPGFRSVLESRLLTVSFGHAHESSSLHDEVIRHLSNSDQSVTLDRIRDAAHLAAEAIRACDISEYASALTMNHDMLHKLHRHLVSAEAHELIELARGHGAVGWKTNGAGGPGGSMVVVAPDDADERQRLVEAINARSPWRCLMFPIAIQGVVARRFDLDDPRFGDVSSDAGWSATMP